MADYATLSDATDLYGSDYVAVAFDPDNTGAAVPAVYASAFGRATSEINGILAGNVTLPLDTVPENLVAYCVDIAIYYGSVRCSTMTEQKAQLFKDAIAAVKHMAKNMVSLGQEDPPPNLTMEPEIQADARIFDRTELGKLF